MPQGKTWIRCRGRGCTHAPNTCTASDEYQAMIPPRPPPPPTEVELLRTRVQKLETAMKFYAKAHNWLAPSSRPCGHLDGSNVLADGGNKAREALA